MNGYDPSQAQANGAPRRVRAPTVDEALPYSPLSSIVPFASGQSSPSHIKSQPQVAPEYAERSRRNGRNAFTRRFVLAPTFLADSEILDLLPYPLATANTANVFDNEDERIESRPELLSLEEEYIKEPTSVKLEKTLLHLQQLLSSENLIE